MTELQPAQPAQDDDEDQADQVDAPADDRPAEERRLARAPRDRQVPHAERNR